MPAVPSPPAILPSADGNAKIHAMLQSREPFIVGRIGTNELCLLLWARGPSTAQHPHRCQCLHHCSGIYPESAELVADFIHLYERSVRSLRPNDLLATFKTREPKEAPLLASLAPHTPLVDSGALAPFMHRRPWSAALADRTVAVLHPFNASIDCQLRRRGELFANPAVLPASARFKLVQMYQALAGGTPHGSWHETLAATKRRLHAAAPFDVALLGVGSYSMPLAGYIRDRLNASVVVMGGISQTLFGLKGERWEEMTAKKMHAIQTAAWIYPLLSDTPAGLKLNGAGTYWAHSASDQLRRCPVGGDERRISTS